MNRPEEIAARLTDLSAIIHSCSTWGDLLPGCGLYHHPSLIVLGAGPVADHGLVRRYPETRWQERFLAVSYALKTWGVIYQVTTATGFPLSILGKPDEPASPSAPASSETRRDASLGGEVQGRTIRGSNCSCVVIDSAGGVQGQIVIPSGQAVYLVPLNRQYQIGPSADPVFSFYAPTGFAPYYRY